MKRINSGERTPLACCIRRWPNVPVEVSANLVGERIHVNLNVLV
jgi:hypothetical protein